MVESVKLFNIPGDRILVTGYVKGWEKAQAILEQSSKRELGKRIKALTVELANRGAPNDANRTYVEAKLSAFRDVKNGRDLPRFSVVSLGSSSA